MDHGPERLHPHPWTTDRLGFMLHPFASYKCVCNLYERGTSASNCAMQCRKLQPGKPLTKGGVSEKKKHRRKSEQEVENNPSIQSRIGNRYEPVE